MRALPRNDIVGRTKRRRIRNFEKIQGNINMSEITPALLVVLSKLQTGDLKYKPKLSRQSFSGGMAFAFHRKLIIRELAELLEVSVTEVHKVSKELSLVTLLELQTMIGKRIIKERKK